MFKILVQVQMISKNLFALDSYKIRFLRTCLRFDQNLLYSFWWCSPKTQTFSGEYTQFKIDRYIKRESHV